MVVGVIIFPAPPGDNASRAAVARPRRGYCVFMIISALLDGQLTFEVAEHYAISLVRKWSTLFDQAKRILGFPGQIRKFYLVDLILLLTAREAIPCKQLQPKCGEQQ